MYVHVDLIVIPDTPDRVVAKSPCITKKSPHIIKKSRRVNKKNINRKQSPPTTKNNQWLTTRKGYGIYNHTYY